MENAQMWATVNTRLVALAMMTEGGTEKQAAALRALGRVGGIEALKTVCTVLDHRAAVEVHKAAIEALGEIGRALD